MERSSWRRLASPLLCQRPGAAAACRWPRRRHCRSEERRVQVDSGARIHADGCVRVRRRRRSGSWQSTRPLGARPALGRGRLHSSGAGVAEPDHDASYVANAIARREAAGGQKRSCGPRQPDARDWATARASPGRGSGHARMPALWESSSPDARPSARRRPRVGAGASVHAKARARSTPLHSFHSGGPGQSSQPRLAETAQRYAGGESGSGGRRAGSSAVRHQRPSAWRPVSVSAPSAVIQSRARNSLTRSAASDGGAPSPVPTS
jgi:hypothetical protein